MDKREKGKRLILMGFLREGVSKPVDNFFGFRIILRQFWR
jgi:hypothetical protein